MVDTQNPAPSRAETLCRYARLDNGIHKLTVIHSSRAAADEWSRHIGRIMEGQTISSPTVRILIDSSAGHLPVGYASSKAREILRKHASPPHIRYAILTNSWGLVAVINTVVRALHLPSLKLRSFSAQQEAEAVTWLLSDE